MPAVIQRSSNPRLRASVGTSGVLPAELKSSVSVPKSEALAGEGWQGSGHLLDRQGISTPLPSPSPDISGFSGVIGGTQDGLETACRQAVWAKWLDEKLEQVERASAKDDLRRARQRLAGRIMREFGYDAGLNLNSDFCRCGEWINLPGLAVRATKAGGVSTNNRLVCQNAVLCPWCACALRELLALLIDRLILDYSTRGYQIFFCVLTGSHQKGEALADVKNDFAAAWDKVSKALGRKRTAAVKAGLPTVERVLVPDLTWSEANGWHPHFNIIFAVPAGVKAGEFRDDLMSRWGAAVADTGRYVNQNEACRFIRIENDGTSFTGISEYVAGVPHSSRVFSEFHTPGREAARLDYKKSGSGYTPFDFLDSTSSYHHRLWVEAAAVFKGSRLYQMSAGMKARAEELKLDLKLDLEAAAEDLCDEDVEKAPDIFWPKFDELNANRAVADELLSSQNKRLLIYRYQNDDWGYSDGIEALCDEFACEWFSAGFTERDDEAQFYEVVPTEAETITDGQHKGLRRVMSPKFVKRTAYVPDISSEFGTEHGLSPWETEGEW